MDKTCFCKPGLMSQCTPLGQSATMCWFYVKHSFNTGCTHLILEGNCDSYKAQMHGYQPHLVEDADIQDILDEMELDVGADIVLMEGDVGMVRRTCMGCINFYGCPAMPNYAAGMGKSAASLVDQDYWDIGSACTSYDSGGGA